MLAQSVYQSVVCVCELVAASTRDDADERPHLLTDDTATAHINVAETIPLARLDQPDVDQHTQAIPSPAGTPTLPSGRESENYRLTFVYFDNLNTKQTD